MWQPIANHPAVTSSAAPEWTRSLPFLHTRRCSVQSSLSNLHQTYLLAQQSFQHPDLLLGACVRGCPTYARRACRAREHSHQLAEMAAKDTHIMHFPSITDNLKLFAHSLDEQRG